MDEYKNHANFYDPVIGPFLGSTYRDMVDILLEHGCSSVLDLCCGTGLFVGKARNVGLVASGVDLSPAMLGVARTKFPEVEFLLHDASSLPIKTGSYDAVTVCFALHEKPYKRALAIAREAARLVRKGGILIVADYRHPTRRNSFFTGWGIRLVEYMAGKEHNAHFQNYMRRGGSEAFLVDAGLNATCRTTHMGGWSGVFVHEMAA